MLRDRTKTIQWRPTRKNGSFGDPVDVVMTETDLDHLHSLARQAVAVPPGPERLSALKEVTVLYDLFALFPGTRFEGLTEPSAVRPEAATGPEDAPETPSRVTGRYHGADPTETEREAGEAVEIDRRGPIRKDGPRHQLLREYELGERLTAYDASLRSRGHEDVIRREARRLFDDGYLIKDGTAQNPRQGGKMVDAYRITDAGKAELRRLRMETAA